MLRTTSVTLVSVIILDSTLLLIRVTLRFQNLKVSTQDQPMNICWLIQESHLREDWEITWKDYGVNHVFLLGTSSQTMIPLWYMFNINCPLVGLIRCVHHGYLIIFQSIWVLVFMHNISTTTYLPMMNLEFILKLMVIL